MNYEYYRSALKDDDDLIDYIIDLGGETEWFYERYLYFLNCAGDKCKYADACLKFITKDIDEYYSRRSADNSKQ